MTIKGFITNQKEQQYMTEFSDFTNGFDPTKVVNVYPEITYQTIQGFGGAFTEASGYNLSLLSQEKQEEILKAYFSEEGLAYNLCRTHINSCDFALGNYAYVEDESDHELSTFSLDRDKKYILPMIQKAMNLSMQPIQFLASPWSPPAFMKTNGEMNHGGKLKEESARLWAQYIARYLKEYRALGIPIDRITIQNEPEAVQTWDSCIYTGEEERDFVKNHLGPVLKEEGLGEVKIIIWDHNKEILYDRARVVLDDPEAAQYVSGVAFHWYTGDHFESIGLVHDRYPKMELLFTEGCVEYSRFMDSNETYKAEMYAHDILGNLNEGMNGYIDWNLLLDQEGGPNHVRNYCASPIMCDTNKNTYEKRLSYYYIGHFSRYIKPGAKRIATTRYTDRLEVTAAINADGSKVVVLLNRSEDELPVCLREVTDCVSFSVPAHSLLTLCY